MAIPKSLANEFAKEPRGGWCAWALIVGGVFPLTYGIIAINSARPAGLQSVFLGFSVVTIGVAESLPANRSKTAAVVRTTGALGLVLFFVAAITSF